MTVNELTSQLLTEAIQNLELAEEELNRPEEDLVALAVCTLSRRAITHFLKSYLSFKNTTIQHQASINELMDQCILLDKHFLSIDLSPVFCRNSETEEDMQCLSSINATHCYATAKKMKKIVTSLIDSETL